MAQMPKAEPEFIQYSRCKLETKLPLGHRYTASHFWLAKIRGPDVWRVGFTKFAARMLGELVEMEFDVQTGDSVALGQAIGKFEGFKAVTDLFCVVHGTFERENTELSSHSSWLRTDPYFKGWLYEARGTPDPAATDARGYMEQLNAAIDKIQE